MKLIVFFFFPIINCKSMLIFDCIELFILNSIDLYVKILSGNFLRSYGNDVINIHHGLLPSFKGGHPSKQVGFLTFSHNSEFDRITIYHRNFDKCHI
jgi:hypothetical protein